MILQKQSFLISNFKLIMYLCYEMYMIDSIFITFSGCGFYLFMLLHIFNVHRYVFVFCIVKFLFRTMPISAIYFWHLVTNTYVSQMKDSDMLNTSVLCMCGKRNIVMS
jgi:hypothetical protein